MQESALIKFATAQINFLSSVREGNSNIFDTVLVLFN